jgi:hypothetical protein
VEISVVVGSVESQHSIRDCLESILASSRGHAVELIVADASLDATAALVRLGFPDATLISLTPGTLTPCLWSAGLAQSRGRLIAFTTGHCIVPTRWLDELRAALELGAAGAGGPLALAADASPLDAAVYFLRYSAFMPDEQTEPRHASDIAGDNSMYRREALTRHAESLRNGFWEVDFHRRLRSDGEHLTMVPRATVTFGRSFPLGVISRHRFAHGRHFGRWRSVEGGMSRWRIMIAAPLVPFLLLLRAARRVKNAGGNISLLIRCSPLLLWLAACWACGEARGAWEARSAPRD